MPTMTRAGYTPPKGQAPKKPESAKPKKKKKKKRVSGAALFSLAVFAIAALLGVGTIYVYMQTQPYQQTYLPGTMLMGYPLAGATQEDALALMEEISQERVAPWQMELTCMDQTYTITAEDVALAIDAEATLAPLWAVGREGGVVARYLEMLRLKSEPLLVLTPELTYDLTAVDELLAVIRADVECPSVDATVTFTPGQAEPFSFTKEEIGYALDVSGVREQIEAQIAKLDSGSMTLEPQVLEPSAYRAQLEEAISLRARLVTKLEGDAATIANVKLAGEKLSGVRVGAGDVCSFNEIVGVRTQEAGYLEAPEPAYGEGMSGVGGGVCQLSTALYRAALLAGLDVRERSAAARPVAYCDMGQEAAVSDQGLDLKIVNPTDSPLFVTARVYEDEGTYLELTVFGEKLDARYALNSLVEETGLIEEPVYIRDREGKYATYTDEREPVGKALPGYSVSVERVKLLDRGKQTQGEIVSQSVYEAVPPTVYVGIKDREA